MSGDHDKYHMTVDIVKYGGVYLSAKEINELREALEDAVYLLNPADEDMQKKAGVYRVVTALEKLKERNAPEAERKWVGLTYNEIIDTSNEFQVLDKGESEHWFDLVGYTSAIEAKLKEKNA